MRGVAELLREVEARGVRVELAAPDRLRVAPRSALTPELVEELRQHKGELLTLLSAGWPPECLVSEKRFGQPHARLFPLLERRVLTPLGEGWLRAVHDPVAYVLLDGERKLRRLAWREVKPEPTAEVQST